ncbi:hypothetical protein EI94DRAFT_1219986 [Lactarius quietus]|nr:hypothetical protein EI94DRAFT_1219986 [Lactarius quietus]
MNHDRMVLGFRRPLRRDPLKRIPYHKKKRRPLVTRRRQHTLVAHPMVSEHALAPSAPFLYRQPSHIPSSPNHHPSLTLSHPRYKRRRTDIRPVFQRFGDIQRLIMGLGGKRADIIFMDGQGVKRTLHAYAEQPIFVRGQEVIVFRKCSPEGVKAVNNNQANANTPLQADPSRERTDWGDGRETIFVSQYPSGTTQDELCEALSRFGKYERFVMRPGSKYAYFIYSSDDRVEQILRSHRRIPTTVRGESLRIERTVNKPYTLTPGSSDIALELGKSLDPADSDAIIEELKQTVPRWRGSYEPSRVLWVGRLPSSVSSEALTNFWSRLGCVVEVRPLGSRTSSFRVRKKRFVLHAREHRMASATRTASSTSTLRRGSSTSDQHTASCTSPVGPHPVPVLDSFSGRTTSPTSPAAPSVRHSLHPLPLLVY